MASSKLLLAAVNDKSTEWHHRYRTVDQFNIYGQRSRIKYEGIDNATVIGRERRDYAWIMARSPHIAAADYERLKGLLAAQGYDTAALVRGENRYGNVDQQPRAVGDFTDEALAVLKQPPADRAAPVERLMAEAYANRRAGNL